MREIKGLVKLLAASVLTAPLLCDCASSNYGSKVCDPSSPGCASSKYDDIMRAKAQAYQQSKDRAVAQKYLNAAAH